MIPLQTECSNPGMQGRPCECEFCQRRAREVERERAKLPPGSQADGYICKREP